MQVSWRSEIIYSRPVDLLDQGSNVGSRDSSVDRLSFFDKAPQDGEPLWIDSQFDSVSNHSHANVQISRALKDSFEGEGTDLVQIDENDASISPLLQALYDQSEEAEDSEDVDSWVFSEAADICAANYQFKDPKTKGKVELAATNVINL